MINVTLAKTQNGLASPIPTLSSQSIAAFGAPALQLKRHQTKTGEEYFEATIVSMGKPIVTPYYGNIVACSRWASCLLGAEVQIEGGIEA